MTLHLDRVSRRYGGLTALHPLTLTIPTGARHAVIGANGAGKSTLFHLIAGSTRPTTGRIVFDGHDVTRARPASRARRGIGRTWQHPAVFDRLTAAANVALAITRHHTLTTRRRFLHPGHTTALVHAALAAAGLTAHATSPAGALPYGLRRRLELAVALAARPRLLLLDEPSAGLDPDEIQRLAATIGALPDTVTVLFIDHHLDLVWQIAGTVTVLHHGHHIATGTPHTVRAHPEVQAAYLNPATTDAIRPHTRQPGPADRPALLRVRGLRAGYHDAQVLHDVDLTITDRDVTAVLGRNGAGKTTLLSALAGLIPTTAGHIHFAGIPLPTAPHHIARAGVAIVPQGRRLFGALTVTDHLTVAEAAARHHRTAAGRRWTRDEILTLLPPLRARLRHHAADLSGGEQQMLAIARALLGNPRLLLLDEPSEGLAPAIIAQLTTALRRIAGAGVTVVLAEQNLRLAVGIADRALGLHHGRITLDLPSGALTDPTARHDLDRLLGVTDGTSP
ncbi:ABC-type sugar transport system ATPase subunit [Micromonospora sp. Llam0]|uniref:ATP-binding cassette domain-containing protein n=1 Tax=Micromonospora sp. Llam0 TaxID=2485143 RepID=UPI000F471303|nr:ATP-binding cassette domain-containing protein [Micromonospora sp. Llam0]ROO63050.1 ABC-type sugar transport system ATPase subunit [Micromonospora sp. Llam0]